MVNRGSQVNPNYKNINVAQQLEKMRIQYYNFIKILIQLREVLMMYTYMVQFDLVDAEKFTSFCVHENIK